MTREQFLNDLKSALNGLPAEELEGVLTYYAEMIDDRIEAGMGEEAAVKAMEPVKVIAARVLEEAGVASDKKNEKPNGNWQEMHFDPQKVHALRVQAQDKRLRIHGDDEQKDIVLHYCIGNSDIFSLREEDGVVTLEHTLRPVSSFVNEKSDGAFSLDSILEGVGKLLNSLGDRVVSAGGLFTYEAPEREIEIILPRTLCAELEAGTSNAHIGITNVTATQPIRLTTSNARITAEDVNCARKITFVTSNSRIKLNDVNVDSASLMTANGRIEMDDMLVRQNLTATTSNGSISAEDVNVGGQLILTTSNGKVLVEDLQCADITIKSSNGGVDGTIKGNAAEYTVVSSTSNGANQLGCHEGGSKKLSVRTSNAPITLEFEE